MVGQMMGFGWEGLEQLPSELSGAAQHWGHCGCLIPPLFGKFGYWKSETGIKMLLLFTTDFLCKEKLL